MSEHKPDCPLAGVEPEWSSCACQTTDEAAVDIVEAGRDNLIGLLRREGAYSGVWFATHLVQAAHEIETLRAQLTAATGGALEQAQEP